MHFAATVILASSLTGFVLGPHLQMFLCSFPSAPGPSPRIGRSAVAAPAAMISQFTSRVQKTVDSMNNLQTTMGKIYASIPSNPHAFALTNNMKAIKAKIFYTGHSLLGSRNLLDSLLSQCLIGNGAGLGGLLSGGKLNSLLASLKLDGLLGGGNLLGGLGLGSLLDGDSLDSLVAYVLVLIRNLSISGCGHDLLSQLLLNLQVWLLSSLSFWASGTVTAASSLILSDRSSLILHI
ncbi:hypothetical protein C8J57DRAFT_1234436 [Mycena rebaudengoi]|nr:hypothetical protein C8J57DRAFT_1234436 [Mycena rebaudengoi]